MVTSLSQSFLAYLALLPLGEGGPMTCGHLLNKSLVFFNFESIYHSCNFIIADWFCKECVHSSLFASFLKGFGGISCEGCNVNLLTGVMLPDFNSCLEAIHNGHVAVHKYYFIVMSPPWAIARISLILIHSSNDHVKRLSPVQRLVRFQ